MSTEQKQFPLVLGTAQLGFSYGIANKVGKMTQDMATEIVKQAWDGGIRTFDTAQHYGESEIVLGNAISSLGISEKVKIISKIDPAIDCSDKKAVIDSVDRSLKNLKLKKLYAVLIHTEDSLLLWDMGVKEAFVDLVRSDRVEKIGVSVYSPQRALQALDIEEINILQVPANILDQRFKKAGVFDIAREKGKEIYIRSIFLQGLLLMDVNEIPKKVDFVKPVLMELEEFCKKNNITRYQLAIGYIRTSLAQSYMIFGAEKTEHVKANVESAGNIISESLCKDVEQMFSDVDEKILNPSLWE